MASCRSCKAPVIWAQTGSGSNMPVDAEPVEGGNVELTYPADPMTAPFATVHGQPPLAPTGIMHTSHFATCPQAGEWRKPKRQPR